MQAPQKLGSDRSFTGLLPAVVTLVSIAIVWILLGKEAAFAWTNLAFAAFTALAFYAWWQTRSLGYLASTLYLLACTLLLAVRNGYIPGGREVAPAFSILLMVSMIFLLFMLLTRQTKWRGRDILELAAGPVAGEAEAFTGRPRAVGRAEYTRDDVLDFDLCGTRPRSGRRESSGGRASWSSSSPSKRVMRVKGKMISSSAIT